MLRKNRKLLNRILSSVLALISVISLLPMQAYSADEEQVEETQVVSEPAAEAAEISVVLTLDGEAVSSLALQPYEKLEIQAVYGAEADSCQWQILHPQVEGLWVNIYDATQATLPVTKALVANMLSEDNVAHLRCRVSVGDTYLYSDVLTVAMGEEESAAQVVETEPVEVSEAAAVMAFSTFALPMTVAEDTDATEETEATEATTPEFVSVTINYVRYDYVANDEGKLVLTEVGPAFTPYVATLKSGSDLKNTTVSCPTIVGYEAFLGEGTEAISQVEINQTNIQQNVTYTVNYKPALVDYEVRYFFQNIYDDLYVEDADLVKRTLSTDANPVTYPVQAQGHTGTNPDITYTHAKFEGFTSLYYEPEKIAADGSTVFHVYYERNYCLMEFDCNGGFGTDTLYVRYGTYISVPEPVRSGYNFAGWDLERTDQTDYVEGKLNDSIADLLPDNMPSYNTAYKALWTKAEATYSVAYWILDDAGNKTYLGSRTVSQSENEDGKVYNEDGTPRLVKTGDTVSGYHDLNTKADGGPYICSLDVHEHSGDCPWGCGYEEVHTHTTDCFAGMTLVAVSGADTNRDLAIADLEDGDPESGYIYVIYNNDSKTYWPKLYMDGTYYIVNGIGDNSEPYLYDVSGFSSIVNGDYISSKTGTYNNGENLTTTKYRPQTNCDKIQHTHSGACCPYMEHDHSDSCYQDGSFMTPIEKVTYVKTADDKIEAVYDDAQIPEGDIIAEYKTDKNVTVLGDNSTVLNVYYEYKTYTFYFYYAKEVDNQFYVFGGSTWAFAGDVNDVPTQLAALNQNHWGAVEQPTLNTTQFRDDTYHEYTVNGETGKYYYITLSARYGDDISEKWPANPFNPVKTTWTDHFGNEAYFSAWNVDANTKYAEMYDNSTLKGNYQKLDDMLLRDGDATKLYYLGFWENGDPDVTWNKPNKWIYNIYIPDASGTYKREDDNYVEEAKHGKGESVDPPYVLEEGETLPDISTKYSLYGSYTIYDDNSNNYTSSNSYSPYCGQTPTALEGYHLCYHIVKHIEEHDTKYGLHTYQIDFYYVANTHSFRFWNYNDWIGDGQGAGNSTAGEGVKYGTPLKPFGDYVDNNVFMNKPEQYPDVLEPDAYEFKGWYTSPGCYDGTEVDWTGYMPDSDLILYAKWEEVTHNVYFYYNYEFYTSAINANENDKLDYYWYHKEGNVQQPESYPIKVKHNSLLGTTYNFTPTPMTGYTFVGWFYIDEEGKKRFAPDTMEVKNELHLFAEWKSEIDTQYTVYYKLEDGTTEIAEPTTGHLTAGKTKTFTAKVGSELHPDYQGDSLFPVTNSHSILMDEDSTENTYTFLYKEDQEVWYRVRYLDKVTGLKLHDEKIVKSDKAIVTEKFVPIEDYYPSEYYIRQVLAYDGTEGSETNILAENEIVFYYTKDEDHGPFAVEYYTSVLGATDDQLYTTVTVGEESKKVPKITNADGSANPYWHLQQSEVGIEDLNKEYSRTIDKDKFDGFAYSQATVTSYGTDDTVSVTYLDGTATTASGTVTDNGLEIRIFYTRLSYDYVIEFVEYGSGKVIGYGGLSTEGVLEAPPDVESPFESTISYTAPDTIEKTEDGNKTKYIFYATDEKPQKQSWTIRASDTENVLTFYYKVKTVQINYEAVCSVASATDFGAVTLANERAATAGTLTGSVAYAANGFEFKGWFTDKTGAAGTAVSQEWQEADGEGTKLKVQTLPDADEVTYYALFEPVQEDLTIIKTGDNLGTDTFLFQVTGTDVLGNKLDMIVSIQGAESVTIKDLYCGTYTVTELTNWSWTYTCEGKVSQDVTLTTNDNTATYPVSFKNEPKTVDWLHGESEAKENQFK